MREKIVKSPAEHGEYLLSDDLVGETPSVSIFFRLEGEEDWESWSSAPTWEAAEEKVRSEMLRVSAS